MSTLSSLPSMEYVFEIDVKGEESQRIWQGTFKYKRLTLGSRLAAAKKEVYLTEEIKYLLPNEAQRYAEMIAWLRFGLVEYPDWWAKDMKFGLDIYDMNIITNLWKKTQEFEEKWDKEVFGPKEEKKSETPEEKDPKVEPKQTQEEEA